MFNCGVTCNFRIYGPAPSFESPDVLAAAAAATTSGTVEQACVARQFDVQVQVNDVLSTGPRKHPFYDSDTIFPILVSFDEGRQEHQFDNGSKKCLLGLETGLPQSQLIFFSLPLPQFFSTSVKTEAECIKLISQNQEE
ncbi:hypothetical protein D9758_000747 [Tetrapyrgos nigripes]|uniref:Uncharacterized protein n=1 Tax=Tetrapyrgos nigripes TaxID=182062 RepID=A0A8H5GZA0_9AGAR|nr:hypothetical protein D9758_000747 [Tetrapyrgos nigripes]